MKISFDKIVYSLVFGVIVMAFVDLYFGSISMDFSSFYTALFSPDQSSESVIIWEYRIPKMLTALLSGFALPLSGLIMQTVFRNPLAGPFVLGVSSGAGLGVALFLMLGTMLGIHLGEFSFELNTVVSGSIGAFAVMLIVLFVSERLKSLSSLLIVGIMISSFSSALIGVLQYYSDNQELRQFLIWSLGNLGSTSWTEILIIFIILTISFLILFSLAKSLNGMALGERYAHTLGVNIKVLRRISLLIASILAGTITAIVGPIAFIGMAIPHISKYSIESVNHRKLIPVSMLAGAFFMLFFDFLSQNVLPNQMLPINIITSLLGAPFVVFVILRRDIKFSF